MLKITEYLTLSEIEEYYQIKATTLRAYINRGQVIPKEVILKKYSPIGELGNFAQEYTDSIFQATKLISCICDRDNIIAVSGLPKKDFMNKKISPQIEKVIEERKTVLSDKSSGKQMNLVEEGKDDEFSYQIIAPIIAQGDPIGAIFLMTNDNTQKMAEAEMKIAETGATFLGKQMEN